MKDGEQLAAHVFLVEFLYLYCSVVSPPLAPGLGHRGLLYRVARHSFRGSRGGFDTEERTIVLVR